MSNFGMFPPDSPSDEIANDKSKDEPCEPNYSAMSEVELATAFMDWAEEHHPLKIFWEKGNSTSDPNSESYTYNCFRRVMIDKLSEIIIQYKDKFRESNEPSFDLDRLNGMCSSEEICEINTKDWTGWTPERIRKFEEKREQEEQPLIKLVSLIILEAFRNKFKVIEFCPAEKDFSVFYKKDVESESVQVDSPSKRLQSPITMRIKVMAGMKLSIRDKRQTGIIKVNILGRGLDVHTTVEPGEYGESIEMVLEEREFESREE